MLRAKDRCEIDELVSLLEARKQIVLFELLVIVRRNERRSMTGSTIVIHLGNSLRGLRQSNLQSARPRIRVPIPRNRMTVPTTLRKRCSGTRGNIHCPPSVPANVPTVASSTKGQIAATSRRSATA